jgi:hypothetical protein
MGLVIVNCSFVDAHREVVQVKSVTLPDDCRERFAFRALNVRDCRQPEITQALGGDRADTPITP